MKTKQIEIGIIVINLIALSFCLYAYLDNRKILNEVEYNYRVMDKGFKDIDSAYSDNLSDVNSYLENAVYDKLLKEIDNESIEHAIIKQVTLGHYFTDYRDAIQASLFDVQRDLETRNRMENVLLTTILVLVTTNVLYLGLRWRFVGQNSA
jgi:hypothetical protein